MEPIILIENQKGGGHLFVYEIM